MKFSTLNETKLHNSLKNLYCTIYEGYTEVEKDGYVYDIITKNGNAVEIQTKNLSRLMPKILRTIDYGHNIKLVHPIIITSRIHLIDEQGNTISNRKSPKRGSIYDILKELTGLYEVLLNKHFSLEIVEIEITEERLKTNHPVQSKNNRRRHKRNWDRLNKQLDKIINTRRFNKKEDYLHLLPEGLNNEFCAKDLEKLLKADKNLPSSAAKNAHLLIWLFVRMGIICETCIKRRTHYYKIKE